jgi:hypothetical protein
MPFELGATVYFPKNTWRPARCGRAALTVAAGAAWPFIPMKRCSPNCARASKPPPVAASSASASRSNTPWPMSVSGKAAVHATAMSARACFDLRRGAVVHSLHVIAHQPAAKRLQLAA